MKSVGPLMLAVLFLCILWFNLYALWNKEDIDPHSVPMPGKRQIEKETSSKKLEGAPTPTPVPSKKPRRIRRQTPPSSIKSISSELSEFSGQVPVWEKGVMRGKEALKARKKQREKLPQIIDAFRRGQIDWHDMIPEHSSLWERFGESKDSNFNFMKLVMKEIKVTDFLTRYESSGLARLYGTEYGTLTNYSSCNVVRDVCAIHAKIPCESDSFCTWNNDRAVCQAARNLIFQDKKRACSSPQIQILNSQGQLQAQENISKCERLITEPVALVKVESDAEAMFFHWWRFFKRIYSKLRDTQNNLDRRSHIIVTKANSNTQFFHYFGLVSDACWRRHKQEVPRGTCVCGDVVTIGQGKDGFVRGPPALQGRSAAKRVHHGDANDAELISHLVKFLGLDTQPKPSRIRIGIISRRRKRFILNEDELVDVALDLGFDVQLLPFEDMTLYEQIAALRMVTVLVGIHGSGLNNAVFLHRGAALIQLLPYKLNYKGAFSTEASRAGVKYFEWAATKRERSVFHWEFVGDAQLRNGKDAYLEKGSPAGGPEVYTFWINQDMAVPVGEFRALLLKATSGSDLNIDLHPPVTAAHQKHSS